MSGLNSRFIWNARYFHIAKANEKLSKFAVSGEYASGLVEYVGTRETVALNFTDEVKDRPATEKQINLIKDLCRSVPNYKNTLEYEDYKKAPTMKNASELIAILSEEVMMHGEFNEAANLVEYAAKRPGAEKVGSHGLFSFEENVDLEKAQEEVATHEGNIWTHVLSLRREDADKLGYDNQASWKALVKSNLAVIAEAHHIKLSNLRWYGAMHNTGYHPHIHLFVFSENPQEGYFSNKGKIDYLEKCKRAFATKIFAADLETEYQAKTEFREELKNSTKEILDKLTENPLSGYSEDIQKDLVKKLTALSESISPDKEVKYGYLKAELKELVNDIQKTLVYENKHLSELYMKWCEHQFNIEKIYVSEPTEVPIEDNKEFIPIKNYIIKVAQNLHRELVIDYSAYEIDNSHNSNSTDESVIKHFDTNYVQNDIDYIVSDDTSSFDYTNEALEYSENEIKTNSANSFEKSPSKELERSSDKELFEKLYDYCNSSYRNGYLCYKLAEFYNYGVGTEKKPEEAMMWYGISADQYQYHFAEYKLGKLYSNKNSSDYNVSLSKEYYLKAYLGFVSEIKNSSLFMDIQDEKELKEFKLEMDVSKSDAYKEFIIGLMYFEGNGVEQDYYKAYQSFYLSSIHGNDNATFYIGKMLIEELGVDKDFDEGIAYLTSAAKAGNSQAAYYLYRHFKKENTAESKVFAQHYLKNAASNKHPIAQIALAKDEYKQGNIAKSIELLNEATENNIADAYYFLGEIYNNSKLSEFYNPDTAYNNFTKAFKLYIRDFNDKPDGHIAYRIARMYHKGLGVTQNIDEALKWYHISSDLENAPAAYSLYKYYRDNDTLDNHKETAMSFLYLASEREHPTAQLKVAKLEYKQGNISKAVEIFQKVADKGIADAQYYLGETHSNLSLSEYYNPELSQSYYASALKTYIADFKSDDAHSFSDESKGFLAYNIAKMYQEGLGTEKNLDEAVKWYRISSDLDNAPASYSLYMYYKENNTLMNHNVIANQFLQLSAERGYSVAQLEVGQLEYERGNASRAVNLFNCVAENNIADGYYHLGEIYGDLQLPELYNSELSYINFSKALNIFIEDFNSEPNRHIAYRIAKMYQDGVGTKKSINEAIKWHDIATTHGNASSAYILYKHYKESDSLLSERYLRTASSLKHPFAQIKVAKIEYLNGNVDTAINLLNNTLDKEIADAYYYLGRIYDDDRFTYRYNPDLAKTNFLRAFDLYIRDFNESPNGHIAYQIARMYHHGYGVEKNGDEAIRWYKIASQYDGNNYHKEIEMASQQVSQPLGMLASTVLHIGKVFRNNTLNNNKKRYTPDKKVARQEKERKLRAGQAQNDSDTYDYNY